MLDTVLEYELVSVAFRPIVRLATARTTAFRVERQVPELGPRLPTLDARALAAHARGLGRTSDLERLWQKVALESLLRRGVGEGEVILPVDPAGFDGAWSPAHLGALARLYGLAPERLFVELPLESGADLAALTLELRDAGFGVAGHGAVGAGNDLGLEWRLRDARGAGADPTRRARLARDAQAAAVLGVRFVGTGLATIADLDAVLEAGVREGTGPVFGLPSAGPEPLDPTQARGLRVRAGRVLVGDPGLARAS